MASKPTKPQSPWGINMTLLKWAAIVLPLMFLVSVDLVRHALFPDVFYSLPGYVAAFIIMALAVGVFAYGIFSLIERLERRIIKQNQQLSALNSIAKAASSHLHLEELLNSSLNHTLRNINADAGLICLVDLKEEEHTAVCYSGFSRDLVKNIQKAKLKDDLVAYQVVRTGEPVIIENVFADLRVTEAARQEGIKSAISSPLKAEGKVNGILAIATHEERHFSDEDKEFLEGISGELGLAIQNASLFEESQFRNQELGALLAVGKTVTSSFNLDELLGESLDMIIDVTSADAAEFWLKENDELAMRQHKGVNPAPFLERARFAMGEGIPGIVAHQQTPMMIHDLPNDSRFLRQGVAKAGFNTFGAVPLIYQGNVVGVLAVASYSSEALKGQRELHLLEGIGEWLTLAIENAGLYRQVQDMAILQERERIAREMHDGMGQLLGYINTQTLAVKKLLSNEQLTDARSELSKMEEVTRNLYADVREGILGLRTSARSEDGLLGSLQEYIDRYMDMTGIKVELEAPNSASALLVPSSTEIQLIRIIQEALTNIRKHSRAASTLITFSKNEDDLQVRISDDGEGFEPTHLPTTGRPRFGLQTMKERAESIGGTLSINSKIGHGTTIEIHMPLAQRQTSEQHSQ